MLEWLSYKEKIISDVITECNEIKAKYKEEKDAGILDKNTLTGKVDLNEDYYIYIDVDSDDDEKLNHFWFSVEDYNGSDSFGEQDTQDTSIESIKYNMDILLEACKPMCVGRECAAEITIKVFFETNKIDKDKIKDDVFAIIKSLLEESSFTDYEYIDVLDIMDCIKSKKK